MVLTKMQTLILWALLAKPGSASFQKDMRPEVKKADREALKAAGLIACEKRGRAQWIEATDKGWIWAGEHLDADLPTRSPAGSAILAAWLMRLKAFMEVRGLVLADVLGPQAAASAGAAGSPIVVGAPEPSRLDYAAVRALVRNAYLDITGGRFNARVPLSDLRQRLTRIDRHALDEALKRMHVEEGTTLSGLDDPQEITPAIRDAGLTFKGDQMYVLWITR